MKRMLVFVIALFAIGQVSAKTANPAAKPDSPFGVSVLKKGSVIQLFYKAEHRGKVKVAIYNDAGTLVFSEVISNVDEFMRPYNFSGLPAGRYLIEIDDEDGKRFQTVEHGRNRDQRVAHLTRLKGEPDRYVLLVPNKTPDVLTVKILNKHNELVYREVQKVEGDFAGLYNLRNINGTHIFEVTDSAGRTVRLSKP